jgi:8-oxo-dGTP diphosphatase
VAPKNATNVGIGKLAALSARVALQGSRLASISPATRPQLAVSAAIFRDGKVLLARRARSPSKGVYSLPGGRVEFGETLHAALHREVSEETALKIEIVELAGWREVVPTAEGGGHYVIMSFAAQWRAGDVVLNEELDDHQWLAPDAIGELRITPGLQDIIQSARRVLGL